MKNSTTSVFFADLSDIKAAAVSCPKSKEELIGQIYAALGPKTESGVNWDALDEVLCDLSWVKEKDVIIVNAGLEDLPEKEWLRWNGTAHACARARGSTLPPTQRGNVAVLPSRDSRKARVLPSGTLRPIRGVRRNEAR